MSRFFRRLALVAVVLGSAFALSSTAEAGVVSFVARPIIGAPIIGRPILARRAYVNPFLIPPGLQPLQPVVVYRQPLLFRPFLY